MSRKTLLSVLLVIALLIVGVVVVSAQDDGTDTPPLGFGMMGGGQGMMGGHNMMGMMGGRGGMMNMMGGGHNMMGMMAMMTRMGEHHEAMTTAIAGALDLETEAYLVALNQGQTLAEIAEAQGVELETIYDVMIAEATAHMTELVEAGTLTQEEVDAHLTWMRENIASMPMFMGAGFGPCMGGAVDVEATPDHEQHHSS